MISILAKVYAINDELLLKVIGLVKPKMTARWLFNKSASDNYEFFRDDIYHWTPEMYREPDIEVNNITGNENASKVSNSAICYTDYAGYDTSAARGNTVIFRIAPDDLSEVGLYHVIFSRFAIQENRLCFYNGNDGKDNRDGISIPLNGIGKWVTIAITEREDGDAVCYIDGRESSIYVPTMPSLNVDGSGNYIHLPFNGGMVGYSPSLSEYPRWLNDDGSKRQASYNGSVSDFRVYDVQMSESEIFEVFAEMAATFPDDEPTPYSFSNKSALKIGQFYSTTPTIISQTTGDKSTSGEAVPLSIISDMNGINATAGWRIGNNSELIHDSWTPSYSLPSGDYAATPIVRYMSDAGGAISEVSGTPITIHYTIIDAFIQTNLPETAQGVGSVDLVMGGSINRIIKAEYLLSTDGGTHYNVMDSNMDIDNNTYHVNIDGALEGFKIRVRITITNSQNVQQTFASSVLTIIY